MGGKCGIIGGRRPEARFEPSSTDPLEIPSGGFFVLTRSCCGLPLARSATGGLFGEPLVNRSGAICLNVTEQSGGAALMNDKILYQTYERASDGQLAWYLGV
jgi:hypothetical protein